MFFRDVFRYFVFVSLGVLSGGLVMMSVWAQDGEEFDVSDLEYVPGEVVVKLKEIPSDGFRLGDTGDEGLDRLLEELGVEAIEESPYRQYLERMKDKNRSYFEELLQSYPQQYEISRSRYIAKIPGSSNVDMVSDVLSQNELIEYAQPNYGGIAEFIERNEAPKYVPGKLSIKFKNDIPEPFRVGETGNTSVDQLMDIFEVHSGEKTMYQRMLEERIDLSPKQLENIDKILDSRRERGKHRIYRLILPPSFDIREVARIFSSNPAFEFADRDPLFQLLDEENDLVSDQSGSYSVLLVSSLVVLFFLGSVIFYFRRKS